jgi:hypothetical protein
VPAGCDNYPGTGGDTPATTVGVGSGSCVEGRPYGTTGGGGRIKGDCIVAPSHRVGVEAYAQWANLFQASTAGSTPTRGKLGIFDAGLAAYKDFCPHHGRLCFTPLAGVQLAFMDPNQDQNMGKQAYNYVALGARAEANASFALGARDQFVFQAMIGGNHYSNVFSAPADGLPASDPAIGLDKGGATLYLGAGFMYRFNTPPNQAPFATLE